MHSKTHQFAAVAAMALLWTHSTLAQNNNPTGPAGQFGPVSNTGCAVSPYTANEHREILDLSAGGMGAYPLQWMRSSNSRQVSSDSFGFGVGS